MTTSPDLAAIVEEAMAVIDASRNALAAGDVPDLAAVARAIRAVRDAIAAAPRAEGVAWRDTLIAMRSRLDALETAVVEAAPTRDTQP